MDPMRASQRQRDRAVRSLGSAYQQGQLSTGTLEVRVGHALGARTVMQLRGLLADVGHFARIRLTIAELLLARRRVNAAPAVTVVLPGPRGAPRLTLGRHPACDVVITDRSVSRYHASLRREGGHWIVHDLGSRNGTWLNGRRATRVEVRPGDELRLGGLATRLA